MKTEDITRFEVIDWRKCPKCKDKGVILVDEKFVECPEHDRGRILVRHNIKVSVSIQDEGRTMKVFVENRNTK